LKGRGILWAASACVALSLSPALLLAQPVDVNIRASVAIPAMLHLSQGELLVDLSSAREEDGYLIVTVESDVLHAGNVSHLVLLQAESLPGALDIMADPGVWLRLTDEPVELVTSGPTRAKPLPSFELRVPMAEALSPGIAIRLRLVQVSL